jgi:1-acyl-sn-glycerol-3-phosphate acyltransferase
MGSVCGVSVRQPTTAVLTAGLYALGALLARGAMLLLARPRLEGRGRIPPRGGLLLVANHTSLVDPVLLAALFPRRLVFVAKAELFRYWPLGWILRAIRAIPVQRGQADIRALREVLVRLATGEVVVVFPEGTRSRTGVLGRARAGVGWLAARSQAPVLPVAIMGTERLRQPASWVRRPQLLVRCGVAEPCPAGGARRLGGYQAVADELLARVAALLPVERRGPYASWVLAAGEVETARGLGEQGWALQR